MKTLIIGIDGATFNIILPMIRNNKLPNIGKILKNGVYGDLNSVFPPITFPAWTSMKTGKNPAKHGVFDFLLGVPYISDEKSGVAVSDKREQSFWKILSNNGYKVGVINVPATYPPEKINGVFISGFGTPSLNSDFTHPQDLKEKLIEKYDFDFDIIENRINGKEKEFIEKLNKTTEKITDSILYVLEKNDFDFLMVNYMAVDQTQHFFFGYKDPKHPLYSPEKAHYGEQIEEMYSLIDKQIGVLLSKIPNNVNIFFVSDHGFGPSLKLIYLNEWLEKEGFLKRKNENKKVSRIKKIPKNIVSRIAKINPKITKILPQSIKKRAVDYIIWTKEIDWSKTKAYAGGYAGKIYVNLKGREKEGIVEPGKEYEQIINELEKKLYQWRNPNDGSKIVDKIYRKEQIYKGRYISIAPDLVAIMQELAYIDRPGFSKGDIFYTPEQGGEHRINGIFIAGGPEIKTNGKKINNLSIYDIAPTILHMYDIPLQKDFDGKVRKEIFKNNSESSIRKIRYSKSNKEKELLKNQINRLKQNGMI